jgi:hypothetical protein
MIANAILKYVSGAQCLEQAQLAGEIGFDGLWFRANYADWQSACNSASRASKAYPELRIGLMPGADCLRVTPTSTYLNALSHAMRGVWTSLDANFARINPLGFSDLARVARQKDNVWVYQTFDGLADVQAFVAAAYVSAERKFIPVIDSSRFEFELANIVTVSNATNGRLALQTNDMKTLLTFGPYCSHLLSDNLVSLDGEGLDANLSEVFLEGVATCMTTK